MTDWRKGKTWEELFGEEGAKKRREQLKTGYFAGHVQTEEERNKKAKSVKAWWENNPEANSAIIARNISNTGRLDKRKGKTLEEIYGEEKANSFRIMFSEMAKENYSKRSCPNCHKLLSVIDALHSCKTPKTCNTCGVFISDLFDKHSCEETIAKLAKIRSPTSIEIILKKKLLLEYPEEEIITEYPTKYFIYDFAILRLRLLFEADGEYWHSFPNAKRRDKAKDTYARNHNWNLIRFSESYLRQWAKDNL